MTLSLSKLQDYAKTRKTKVIDGAYKIADDNKSATFVLESGPKLTMTEAEIDEAIETAEEARRIDEAVAELKASKPKATKPKATKPKATKPKAEGFSQ